MIVDDRDVEMTIAAMERARQVLSDLAGRDQRYLAELKESLPDHSQVVEVPLLDEDVHDVEGLEKLRRAVFTQGRE